MIKPDKRAAIFTLYEAGNTKRQIAKAVKADIKTVRKALTDGPEKLSVNAKRKIVVDEELLRKEYQSCNGFIERMHEKLTEDYGLSIGYSTLTRRIRELGLGQKASKRAIHVPDEPGEEMQYDTSPFNLKLNGKKVTLIASGLYFRYSKIRFIKFYFSDNRFNMKCFLDEALRYWGYCADICIIDNTCLAVWYGTGSNAVFHSEMIHFSQNYGFSWKAHALGHANRKAGKERNFLTLITNFVAGRVFISLEDLNRQAFDWATDRFAKRPQSKTKLIPIDTFEKEKAYLNKLPAYIPLPYEIIKPDRIVDVYGYVAYDANYYWVPEYFHGNKSDRIKTVKVVRYASHIVLYYHTKELLRYNLPKAEVKNERFVPEGVSVRYQPRHRKKTSHLEEKALRALGNTVSRYIDFVKSKECRLRQKHHYLRRLFLLSGKIAPSLFIRTIAQALQYRVDNVDTLSRIASQIMSRDSGASAGTAVTFNNEFMERDAYKEGCLNDERDIEPPGLLPGEPK